MAETIAADRTTLQGVLAAQRLGQAGGSDKEDMPELRAKVNELELLSADVALLLHQEKLETAPTDRHVERGAASVGSDARDTCCAHLGAHESVA